MAKQKVSIDKLAVLQAVVGVALFLIGLLAIVNYNSTGRELQRSLTELVGGKSDTMDLVFGILLVASAVLVAGAVFVPLDKKLLFLATLVAFIVWAVRIVLLYIVADIFEPDFLVWATPLSVDLIVLMALWIVNRRYAR